MSISTIKYGFLLLIMFFLTACTQTTEKTKCNTRFSVNEFFKNTIMISKKLNRNEKILSGFNKDNELIKEIGVSKDDSEYKQKNESFAFVSKYNFNKLDGFSFSYFDQNLTSITHYSEGIREGIYLTLKDSYPSHLVIYSKDNMVGMVAFLKEGSIRSIKFGTEHNKTAGTHSYVYKNGIKAFEYITENSVNYWVVYSSNGQLLLKYPRDNDLCKVQFFEKGKEVKIPLYFDQKEFEKVYKKVKSAK